MITNRKTNFLGQLLLFSATLFWGTSFVFLKETITNVPPCFVIGTRFLIASALLFIIFFKRIIKVHKETVRRAIVLGIVLALAYFTQTIGLFYATPGRSAFLTGLYCVMTPFLLWGFNKKKPEIFNVVSAVLCVVGLGFILLSNGESGLMDYFWGNVLTVIGAFFFAMQIIVIDHCQEKGDDSMCLLFIELLCVGIILSLLSFATELPKNGFSGYKLSLNQAIMILYLTLCCTLYAQLAQIVGMKYTSPNQSALILSLEAVFGALFSIILGYENATPLLIIGFAFIFIAILTTELHVDFKKLFHIRKKDEQ